MSKKELIKGDTIAEYKKSVAKKSGVCLCLGVVTVLCFVLCLSVGSGKLTFVEVVRALFGKGDETNVLIMRNIRLPRVIAAVIAGGGLAISGGVMQSVLRNPVASPSTLGVGNAAVFGANFAIIVVGAGAFHSTHGTWLTIENPYLVSFFAFLFSVVSVGVILLLTRTKKFGSSSIVLSGVAIGAIFQAATTLVQYFASDTYVASAVYWTFGDLSRATYREDLIMAVVVAVGFVFFFIKRWDYSAMANGNSVASGLGVNTLATTIISLLLASLITAVCVAFLGIIGFIGLIAPQIMRKIIGDDFRFLLPTSFLCGATVLLVADTLGRIAIAGTTLPVGAITSLIGGPVFLYLLLKEKNGYGIKD